MYAAPEVATLLMNAGCVFPTSDSHIVEGKDSDAINAMVYQFELSLFTLVCWHTGHCLFLCHVHASTEENY